MPKFYTGPRDDTAVQADMVSPHHLNLLVLCAVQLCTQQQRPPQFTHVHHLTSLLHCLIQRWATTVAAEELFYNAVNAAGRQGKQGQTTQQYGHTNTKGWRGKHRAAAAAAGGGSSSIQLGVQGVGIRKSRHSVVSQQPPPVALFNNNISFLHTTVSLSSLPSEWSQDT